MELDIRKCGYRAVAAALLLAVWPAGTPEAQSAAKHLPVIAIVLDDIGNHRTEALRLLELPGPLSFAFLPHTPYARSLAEIAHQLGNDVLLHLPMDANRGQALGPGGITEAMSEAELIAEFSHSLAAIPHAIGVSNHMGSRLTRKRTQMVWLMQALKRKPELMFLDSRTTEHTVAADVARELGIPTLERDVFLDNEQDEESIRSQLLALVRVAKRHGSAVGIGHPYPETIEALEEFLPMLSEFGVRLLRASSIINQLPEHTDLQTARVTD